MQGWDMECLRPFHSRSRHPDTPWSYAVRLEVSPNRPQVPPPGPGLPKHRPEPTDQSGRRPTDQFRVSDASCQPGLLKLIVQMIVPLVDFSIDPLTRSLWE